MSYRNEESITMTASFHESEDEDMTPEQAAVVEWLKKPENREHITQVIRAAAEAACAAVHGMCLLISAAADLVQEVYRTITAESDGE